MAGREENSLKDWDPSKENALETSETNVRAILADKDEALRLVELQPMLARARPAALTEAAHTDLVGRMETFRLYVAGWRAAVQAASSQSSCWTAPRTMMPSLGKCVRGR